MSTSERADVGVGALARRCGVALLCFPIAGALGLVAACLVARAYTLALLSACLLAACAGLAMLVGGAAGNLRRAAIAMLVLGLARGGFALRPASGHGDSSAPIRTRFVRAPSRPWFAGLPEGDLVSLGILYGASPFEYEGHGGPRGLQRDFRAAYDEVEAGGVFEREEGLALDSWLVDRGQYWLCEPEGNGPFPLLVWLHGTGGGFQAYAAWIARAARARGVATAFPVSGFGIRRDQGAEEILAVAADVARSGRVDPGRVFVCGLSAGAPAAFEAARRDPARFAGVIALSGVPPHGLDLRFLEGKRALVIHGARDPRCRVEGARALVRSLGASGVAVRTIEYPDEDHFLIAARHDEVTARMVEFVEGERPPH